MFISKADLKKKQTKKAKKEKQQHKTIPKHTVFISELDLCIELIVYFLNYCLDSNFCQVLEY